jgi:hypothetical protein
MLWYQLMQSEHFHVYLNHSEANVTQRSRRYFHWTATGRSAPEDVFIGLQRDAALQKMFSLDCNGAQRVIYLRLHTLFVS